METIKVQDIAVNDLPWIIEHHSERCTLCGSCVASCTFGSIKPVVERQSITVSEANQPTPLHRRIALPIIKQVASLANACRGCGMCERVCPNNAIHPRRNPDSRWRPLGPGLAELVPLQAAILDSALPGVRPVGRAAPLGQVPWVDPR